MGLVSRKECLLVLRNPNVPNWRIILFQGWLALKAASWSRTRSSWPTADPAKDFPHPSRQLRPTFLPPPPASRQPTTTTTPSSTVPRAWPPSIEESRRRGLDRIEFALLKRFAETWSRLKSNWHQAENHINNAFIKNMPQVKIHVETNV